MTVEKLPFHGGRQCYACDAKPVGLRDRRPEGHGLEVACSRHADPRIKVFAACIYCGGPVRKGSVTIDGQFAHKSCHAMVVNDTFHGVMDRRNDARAKRQKASLGPTAAPAPLNDTLHTKDGPIKIANCSTETLKAEYPYAPDAKGVLIGAELATRGWTPSANTIGPITWSRIKTVP